MTVEELLPPAPASEAIAAANRVLAALFDGGLLSARVAFFPPEGGQRRYWAAVTAWRTAAGVTEVERRPRRLVVHPARTFGCSGGGPAADPRMPLPALDRLWVVALRNYLDGLPPGTPGQRLPASALAWLAAHPAALPPAATLTLAGLRTLLEQEGMASALVSA